jgi:hypothetical protein
MPFGLLLGDCNPGPPTHWIPLRAKQGHLILLHSKHRDNPELYDPETGELTEGGKQRMAALESLTGTQRERLLHGKWVMPEGAIYSSFRDEIHKIATPHLEPYWPRVVGIDPTGAYVAAVWLAFDPRQKVLIVYREYYEEFGLTTRQHVVNMLAASGYNANGQAMQMGAEPILAWVGGGPSERQQRMDFASHGIPIIEPANYDVWHGIDKVHELIKDNSIYISEDCPNLLTEFGSYRRMVDKAGNVLDKIQDDEKYHLLSALRYIINWLSGPETSITIGHR